MAEKYRLTRESIKVNKNEKDKLKLKAMLYSDYLKTNRYLKLSREVKLS